MLAFNPDQNLRRPCSLANMIIDRIGTVFLLILPLMVFLGIALGDIAMTTIGVLFVLRSVINKEAAWLRESWIRLALALWLFLVVSSFFVTYPKQAFSQALPFVRFILFGAGLQFWLLADQKRRQWGLYALGITLIFIAFNTIFSYVSGYNFFGKTVFQKGVHFNGHWVWNRISQPGSYARLKGINGKLNAGTMMTWLSFPFIAFLLTRVKEATVLKRFWSAAGILLILLAVMLTGERMPFLEMGLGFVLLFFMLPSFRLLLAICGGLILLMFAGAMLIDHHLWNRDVLTVIGQAGALGHNVYGGIFAAAFDMFKHHPVAGVGLKQFQYLCSQAPYAVFQGCNTHPQNIYLEWLSGTGLIGTILFLGIMFCWIKKFWQSRRLLAVMPVAVAAIVGFFIRAWPIASTTSFFFAWGGVSFWWMGAWALAAIEDKKSLGEVA